MHKWGQQKTWRNGKESNLHCRRVLLRINLCLKKCDERNYSRKRESISLVFKNLKIRVRGQKIKGMARERDRSWIMGYLKIEDKIVVQTTKECLWTKNKIFAGEIKNRKKIKAQVLVWCYPPPSLSLSLSPQKKSSNEIEKGNQCTFGAGEKNCSSNEVIYK